MDERTRLGSGGPGPRGWLLLVLLLSFVPVRGLFTTSRIFFIRDLSFFFWSRHLWFRHTMLGGQAPWWDPYVSAGQSAIADALNEMLMPLTVAVRLLPSAIVSFNLWVALPVPIAAVGTFVFLRGRLGPAAAALGACVFALSGPIVSMVNLPNLAWSVALLPWVLAATDHALRPTAHGPRITPLAIAFALQALSGEPVTWTATAVLAGGYAIVGPVPSSVRCKIGALAGLACGALLAAAQLVPTVLAGVRAHRAALATPDFWSLHPIALWEALAPHLFGNYYDAFLADLPWIGALNFGRDPFFYSLYVGPIVLLLAVIATATRPWRSAFWLAAFVAFTIAALGGYTPLYPLLRRAVPALMYFRFPVKYIVLAAFALAVLAAEGFAEVMELPPKGGSYGGGSDGGGSDGGGSDADIRWLSIGAGALGIVCLAVSLYALVAPGLAVRAARWLAVATHLKEPNAGAAFLARGGPPLAARASALLVAGAILVVAVTRRRAAIALLFVAVCADLAITNGNLNLTMDLTSLSPPAWFTAASGTQRLYIGGRVRGFMNGNDPDGVSMWQIPAESTAIEGRMELNALLPMAPSGWRVREALSYDLPVLWPSQYDLAVRQFEQSGPERRDAFLRRSGVRWCVLSRLRQGYVGQASWRVVAEVDDWNMRVYDCHPDATRVFVTDSADAASDGSNDSWEREALFDPALPDTAVRVSDRLEVAGRPGAPQTPSARIVEDGATLVTVEASLARPGVLVLRDTFDPSWSARVDDTPARIVRANGLHRAVALPAGRHVIRFTYRPRDLLIGLMITVAMGLALGFARV